MKVEPLVANQCMFARSKRPGIIETDHVCRLLFLSPSFPTKSGPARDPVRALQGDLSEYDSVSRCISGRDELLEPRVLVTEPPSVEICTG